MYFSVDVHKRLWIEIKGKPWTTYWGKNMLPLKFGLQKARVENLTGKHADPLEEVSWWFAGYCYAAWS